VTVSQNLKTPQCVCMCVCMWMHCVCRCTCATLYLEHNSTTGVCVCVCVCVCLFACIQNSLATGPAGRSSGDSVFFVPLPFKAGVCILKDICQEGAGELQQQWAACWRTPNQQVQPTKTVQVCTRTGGSLPLTYGKSWFP